MTKLKYTLYNVTGNLVDKPCKILDITARRLDDAFIKIKKELSYGLKEQLGLNEDTRIEFTKPCSDSSLGYGEDVKYFTCSIEDAGGYVIDTYDYAIKPNH